MNFSRRKLLAGGAALAAAAVLPAGLPAAPAPTALRVVKRSLEVNGRAASGFGILQPDGTARPDHAHEMLLSAYGWRIRWARRRWSIGMA